MVSQFVSSSPSKAVSPMANADVLFSNVIPFKAEDLHEDSRFQEQPSQTDWVQSQRQVAQLQQQVLLLTKKLEQANSQTEQALNLAKTRSRSSAPSARRPKPATMPTTYTVPKRSRSQRIDRWTTVVPFCVMTALFGAGLAAAVATASPSFSLWVGLSPFLISLMRGLFVAIAFSAVISFFLELWQARLA